MRVPKIIEAVLQKLHTADYEAYIVGGAVRHLALGLPAADLDNWDLASNAKPEAIQTLFKKSFYENNYGTVTIAVERKGAAKPLLIEITPYRIDGDYSNKRHPDAVIFTDSLDADLARRDFTINAMALGLASEMKSLGQHDARLGERFLLHDPFGGIKDLNDKVVRAVGGAKTRFDEDALRMLRAVRFATTLEFDIEPSTKAAIAALKDNLAAISKERVRDELSKIVMARQPERGLILLKELGLLKYVLPELLEGVNIEQRGPHRYDVFKHNTLALKFAAEEGAALDLRLAALLHDVGKPATRAETPQGTYTFYGHNVVGAKMAAGMLKRLKYPSAVIESVRLLIYHHLFFYDADVVTESSVRRLLAKVGKENIAALISLRLFDRQSTPVPKRKPYKLRHLEYMIDKVSADPISVGELALGGSELMAALKIEPGPQVGLLLKALLAEVLDDPKLNIKAALLKRSRALNKMTPAALRDLGERVEAERAEQDAAIKAKHFVS